MNVSETLTKYRQDMLCKIAVNFYNIHQPLALTSLNLRSGPKPIGRLLPISKMKNNGLEFLLLHRFRTDTTLAMKQIKQNEVTPLPFT